MVLPVHDRSPPSSSMLKKKEAGVIYTISARIWGTKCQLLIIEAVADYLSEAWVVIASLNEVKAWNDGQHCEHRSGANESSAFINIRPVLGMRDLKLWDSIIRFAVTFKYPAVVLAVAMWISSRGTGGVLSIVTDSGGDPSIRIVILWPPLAYLVCRTFLFWQF